MPEPSTRTKLQKQTRHMLLLTATVSNIKGTSNTMARTLQIHDILVVHRPITTTGRNLNTKLTEQRQGRGNSDVDEYITLLNIVDLQTSQ